MVHDEELALARAKVLQLKANLEGLKMKISTAREQDGYSQLKHSTPYGGNYVSLSREWSALLREIEKAVCVVGALEHSRRVSIEYPKN